MAWAAAPALAAFVGSVLAESSFASYTVPAPGNVRCTGLGVLRGQIVLDPVTPPSGATISYDITQPDGRVVNSAATSYSLPAVSLIGSYVVQARLSAGGWRSAGVTINVTNVAGVYICA
ncbi:hypothetical protein Q5424_08120 [Conexibacter sp. JD483]|uniref:hypothetical protein n=1 Tax=unclassified Conexibacter TaxID=2627773 RepID=UPI00271AE0BF|nr:MULTISPECIES: hypothetical protein [unclassified Conexibacter]MDO8183996.1 hypothetical protein [Conexibacter sp. CPCC 205706]MDO8196988.1 hypothetical protein [Conexibacter sp. CPCC 205762]MDR9369042.1 hypothetical protein [Conexibacter sp. JD483]